MLQNRRRSLWILLFVFLQMEEEDKSSGTVSVLDMDTTHLDGGDDTSITVLEEDLDSPRDLTPDGGIFSDCEFDSSRLKFAPLPEKGSCPAYCPGWAQPLPPSPPVQLKSGKSLIRG